MTDSSAIRSVLDERRVFPPPPDFAARARIRSIDEYREMYRRSVEDPEGFWAGVAKDLRWFEPWTKVLEWDEPYAKWFVGARTNLAANCLDRWKGTPTWDKPAIVWEGEPGDGRTLTYRELHRQVCRFAAALRRLGVKSGDRVGIYLPMVPEAAIAMLACARIGAAHSVVFGGFSAEALKDRLNDAGAVVLVTADGGWRRGQSVPLKRTAEVALAGSPWVRNVIVLQRTGEPVPMKPGRDLTWDEAVEGVPDDVPAEPLDSEHLLFTLYTSGTTGKPKGIVHTTGGYMVGTYATTRWVFDIRDDDVYWCTADVGWITGHSYVVYGPLQNGATVVMYEGAPNHPTWSRFWEIVERYRVTIFYTAPTAIRAFMRAGDEHVRGRDLSSLRLLGTVGEPINPEAWIWYRETIGGGRCPIVDTWWQTETGAIMISPLPGATPTKPGTATLPLPGVVPEIVTKDGRPVPRGQGGLLVLRRPWPSMLRGIWRDDERYRKQYWSEVPHAYFTGDGAREDEDGYVWLMGRVDDVLNVAGHRLGTMEIESALVAHPDVAEAAVVGKPDEVKGEAIAAFVTLKAGRARSKGLEDELRAHVAAQIGAIAKPDVVRFTDALPKTRSGKIMRRLLKKVASGDPALGDTTTLEDISVLARLRGEEEE